MKGLTVKLTFAIGLCTFLLSTFLFYRTYRLTDKRLNEAMARQAELGLQFDLAIREYAGEQIRPVMYDLLGADEFIPETMSTSFVARSIFDMVRESFPQYIIKFSSDNPRNPANQAGPEELAIIQYFNENPEVERWSGRINIDGKEYVAQFSARRMTKSCLNCHGDPKDAPRSLIERYGGKAGFYRPLGEVIGTDTVAIPVSDIRAPLWRQSIETFFVSALGILVFFFGITLVFSRLVTKRLSRINGYMAEMSSRNDYKDIVTIPVDSNDEIGHLADNFNRLFLQVHEARNSLESTVRDRTEDLLRANRELLREVDTRAKTEKVLALTQFVIDHLSDPVIFSEEEGRLVFVNKAACDNLQYSEAELMQMKLPDINPDLSPESFLVSWEMLRKKGAILAETDHRRKDGTIFPVEVTINHINFDGVEYRCAFVRDITNRKRAEAERQSLEKRLNQAMKMEVIGTLAGGVAHDLNNILSGIVSYPELILLNLSKDHELRPSIETIQRSGEKAAVIVQDLLTLARRGVSNVEPVNINQVLDDFLSSPEAEKMRVIHPGCIIHTQFDTALLNINGSAVHLGKTVMNLVLNALEAMPDGGEMTLKTENCYVDYPVQGYDEIQEGDYVRLTVSDTGTGISEKDREKIFEPFYTRKVMGRSGTGLGMTVVWGTVKDHGGFIDITGAEGSGTSFMLYFPATRKKIRDEGDKAELSDIMGAGELILVVDDILEQRQIATAILEKLGYKVITAEGGEEAVEYLARNSVDLIILDMIMLPGIDGLETYQRIIEIHPGQRALIVSGYSESWRVKSVQKLGAGEYVKKPYTIDKIGLAVRRALAGSEKAQK